MPLKNYTTKISVWKTVGEIQRILANAGAAAVSISYDQLHEPQAVTFTAQVRDRPVQFRLPANVESVHHILVNDPDVPNKLKSEEQAARVAWRIIKDWIDSQMAFLESEQVELAQLFLPHAVSPATGRTLYDEFATGRLLPRTD